MTKIYVVTKYAFYDASWIIYISYDYTKSLEVFNKTVSGLECQQGVKLNVIPMDELMKFGDDKIKTLHRIEHKEEGFFDLVAKRKEWEKRRHN